MSKKIQVGGVTYTTQDEVERCGCVGCAAADDHDLCERLSAQYEEAYDSGCGLDYFIYKRMEDTPTKVKVVFKFKPGTEDAHEKAQRILRYGLEACIEYEPDTFEALKHFEIKEK